jgi:hypothetical protein
VQLQQTEKEALVGRMVHSKRSKNHSVTRYNKDNIIETQPHTMMTETYTETDGSPCPLFPHILTYKHVN